MDKNNHSMGLLRRSASFVYPAYLSVARAIRSHRLSIRLLFKVKLPKKYAGKVSWDFTTLVLKRALRQCLKYRTHISGSIRPSLLEIGIGQAALLCIYLARSTGLKPDGIDIVPQRVEQSRQIARFNSVQLELHQSDLFENMDCNKKYDVIFWNSSYIPTATGNRFHLTQSADIGDARAWDGGSDGTEVIGRFLSGAPFFLRDGGNVLLGVNRFYVSDDIMLRLIETSPLKLKDRVCSPFNPSVVYILSGKETSPEPGTVS